MQTLILQFTENDRQEIQRIKLFAEQNTVDAHTLAAIGEGFVDPAGKDINYTCKINEFTIAYSIEEQPYPTGWVRHLSLSQTNGELVNPVTTAIIMTYFDFKELNPMNSFYQLDEQSNPKTVHILEPLNCKWSDLIKEFGDLEDKEI